MNEPNAARLTRRQFVGRSALYSVAVLGLGTGLVEACGSSGTSTGQVDDLTRLQTAKRALIGTFNDPPQCYFDGQKWTGLGADLMAAILPKIGIPQWDYVVNDWNGLIPGIQARRWDFISEGADITEARQKIIGYSRPVYQAGDGIGVKSGNPLHIKAINDLKGKEVGVILGSAPGNYAKDLGATVVTFKTLGDCIAALQANRVPIILSDEFIMGYAFKVSSAPNIELIHDYEGKQNHIEAIIMRKDEPRLKEAVDKVLNEMRADGSLLALLKTYGLAEANMVP